MQFAADENFNNDLLRALRHHISDLDVIRIQDTEVVGASDPELLAWLAEQKRVLLTHDAKTMPGFAYERVSAGLPMQGVVEVNDELSIGKVLDDLIVLIQVTNDHEWENQVKYVPIR